MKQVIPLWNNPVLDHKDIQGVQEWMVHILRRLRRSGCRIILKMCMFR